MADRQQAIQSSVVAGELTRIASLLSSGRKVARSMVYNRAEKLDIEALQQEEREIMDFLKSVSALESYLYDVHRKTERLSRIRGFSFSGEELLEGLYDLKEKVDDAYDFSGDYREAVQDELYNLQEMIIEFREP